MPRLEKTATDPLTQDESRRLQLAVIAYVRMTAGQWIGGASGYSPPTDWPPELREAWSEMENAAWGSDHRNARQ